MSEPSELARLRWRCRRGTRELDALVGWWLDARYPVVDAQLRQAFAELLDVQDPDLWDWLVGRREPDRADWRDIIREIRDRPRV
ncbi:succinate dehydrogenase assembly factor 2 [Tahibacter amnicola]|uniref:FAD assembly factor SdhE n=1 Tax=Tahibacter amnicola TaxID=2976241 RepID=A0ABY6BBZ7_9GAMM|nr:succinate dehydrogenase assembly factor 2 [Tahibacter amnicola]UXI66688.1 succinate dehydrogenase assembly factor 2 [Tahibacter amnicola]